MSKCESSYSTLRSEKSLLQMQKETERVRMDSREADNGLLTRERGRTSSVISGGNLAAAALRFKRKEALPGGGGLRQGKDQVLADIPASDGEQESSTEELEILSAADSKSRAKTVADTEEQTDEYFLCPRNVDAAEMERICSAILPTAVHQSSDEGETYTQYIKQVMELPTETFDSLYEMAKHKESTELHLVCTIKGAMNLQPKDSKSMSDVICHLSIFPSSKMASSSTYSANITDWVAAGVVGTFKKTTFVPSTSNPRWNQSFQLSLSDPQQEMIVAEVWGRKSRAAQSKKHKEYYDKQDNFIGRAFYLLKTTPIDGEDKLLSLYSHSGKHERGTIDLHLSIQGQNEDVPVNVSIREHTLLLKLLINHEARAGSGYAKFWDGRLGEKAELILLQHVKLSGINSLHEKSARFHVFLEYHQTHKMKMLVFSELLEEIVANSLSEKEKEEIWVKQLLFNMQALYSSILDPQLNNHLTDYNFKTAADVKELTCIIKCLKLMFSYPELLDKLKDSKKDLKGSVEICIQAAVPNWFLELSKSMLRSKRASGALGDDAIMTLKGFCCHCLKHSNRALKLLHPVFESIDVDYFSTFYIVLDKLLLGDVITRLQQIIDISNDQDLYELYVVFKDLSKLSSHVNESRRSELSITSFHNYFKGNAVNWIDLGTYKCKEKIEQAIEFDESMNLELDQPRFSSSAIDTSGFLLQLGIFWKNLEWPIATDAIGYLCTITEHLSQMSLHYVERLYHSLLRDSAAMYDSSGRFQSSERLCTILNNMYHVKKTLADMPVTLELDKYYDWLESECSSLGSKAKKLVNTLLKSHDEDIENKISFFVDRITERLTPDISHFFELIVPANSGSTSKHRGRTQTENLFPGIRWPWQKGVTEDTLANEEAIAPLLDYLAANLQILGDYLLTPVLHGILHKLWYVLIGVVQGRMAVIPRNPSALYLYERLQFFMMALKVFFHADGNGMALANLETEPYKFIIEKLNLIQTSSKDLIQRYLTELEGQQKYIEIGASLRQGTLHMSVGYLIDKGVIEVSIIQAKNLPGKGYLSTSVEVFLLPNWLFSKSAKKIHKTAVVKGTTSPFYGEEFHLPAKEERLIEVGSVLVAFVIDEESSSVIGMNMLSCLMLPRLYAHVKSLSEDESVPVRQKSELILFAPKEVPSLKELEARLETHDQDVAEFYKANPRLFQKKKRTITKMSSRERKKFDY